eukprot:m.382886 g.382886  ORF g.382886 m.382886 type:complete len:327 (-) comp20976_c0_seq24:1160-2140(-)
MQFRRLLNLVSAQKKIYFALCGFGKNFFVCFFWALVCGWTAHCDIMADHNGNDVHDERWAVASAERLLGAWVTRTWIHEPLSLPSPRNIQEIYSIQSAMHTCALAQELGGVAGYKQGGIDAVAGEAAVYGVLFKNGIINTITNPQQTLSKRDYNLFGLEPEVAFLLGADLLPREDKQLLTEEEVYAAVDTISFCIELCGKRHTIPDASPMQCLADASCAGGVALGPSWSTQDKSISWLRKLSAHLIVNETTVATGHATDNPLGSPVSSLAWCANHLHTRGMALKKGQIVIGGAICKSRDFHAGDTVRAEFYSGDVSEGCVGITIAP